MKIIKKVFRYIPAIILFADGIWMLFRQQTAMGILVMLGGLLTLLSVFRENQIGQLMKLVNQLKSENASLKAELENSAMESETGY